MIELIACRRKPFLCEYCLHIVFDVFLCSHTKTLLPKCVAFEFYLVSFTIISLFIFFCSRVSPPCVGFFYSLYALSLFSINPGVQLEMNEVAITRLEVDYQSKPYGKPLLRGVVEGDSTRLKN